MYENFEGNKYTLGVFIDLAKAFDTVDHKILLRKMEIYGIGGTTLKWFENYLTNRKQYIQISNIKKTNLKDVACGAPQGSILGPLLFLIYVNGLQYASNLLDPIMFADETNLFSAKENIKTLFDILTLNYKKLVSGLYPINYLLMQQKQNTHFFINPARKIIFP